MFADQRNCAWCGHRLGRTETRHACQGRQRSEYAAATLFSFCAPQVYDWFVRLTEMVAALGPVEVKVGRTRVDYSDGQVFASVRPERDAMMVGLVFADLENLDRFVSIEQQDDGTWLHTLRIAESSDLDDELAGWLSKAREEIAGAKNRIALLMAESGLV